MRKICIFIIAAVSITVKCDCTNEFDENEEKCAKPLDLDPINVFYFFTRGYADVDALKVENFVECTWKKWKFQNIEGNIEFQKIKQDKAIVWKFARFCAGLVYNITIYENAFQRATLECQNKSSFTTAESVRLCITGNYEKYLLR